MNPSGPTASETGAATLVAKVWMPTGLWATSNTTRLMKLPV